MESHRFEVLPGSVDNHLATSAFRYALERHQPVRGGYLDDPDGGRCGAPARQKPEDGKHRPQLRISLNVNASCMNSALDTPAPAVRHQVASVCANSGLAPGGSDPSVRHGQGTLLRVAAWLPAVTAAPAFRKVQPKTEH